jgi:hypothetical protein
VNGTLFSFGPEVVDLGAERGIFWSPVKNRERLMGLIGEPLLL